MNFFKYQDFPSTNRTVIANINTTPVGVPLLGEQRPNSDPRNASQTMYDNTNDDLWLEQWLQQIGLLGGRHSTPAGAHDISKTSSTKTPAITIKQTTVSLRECLLLLRKLDEVQTDLESNVDTMSSTDWKQKTIEIGMLKDEFTKLMAKFENTDAVALLKTGIEKRRRKRTKQKARRQFKRTEMIAKYDKRAKMHKDIDQWLNSMRDETEKAKTEENLKKDADCVLGEVTKKKSEARKQLSLISALVKLRSVRETAAAHRGEKTSVEDRQAFNIATEKLVKIWENSLKTYSVEEQGLRLMLEKSAQDDSKAAKLAKEKKLLENWRDVLFGGKHLLPINNPTYWALTAAERDTETFIAIRKSWDTFLVPYRHDMGSKIPMGWVLPDKTPSKNWTQYLQH